MTDTWPDRLAVRPLTVADAERIATWTYDGPWEVYDSLPGDELLTAEDGYLAVASGDELVGFCCTGMEARVPGQRAAPGVFDLGFGMDPRFVGAGHGLAFGTAIMEYLRRRHGPVTFRAVVQVWNKRSLGMIRKLGFTETDRLISDAVEYLVLRTEG
ncbi:N-acetyltransferase [Pseudonocardiaceae bacterium YIM PH 21723]|nr:N-acetyltransferase [Pseudonocardiaceae bacterium YIM PH 21723]